MPSQKESGQAPQPETNILRELLVYVKDKENRTLADFLRDINRQMDLKARGSPTRDATVISILVEDIREGLKQLLLTWREQLRRLHFE